MMILQDNYLMTSNLQIKVKFSDLTVDSFHFLQLLEYDANLCKRSKQVKI